MGLGSSTVLDPYKTALLDRHLPFEHSLVWRKLWELPHNVAVVDELFTPAFVEQIVICQPKNMTSLLLHVARFLAATVHAAVDGDATVAMKHTSPDRVRITNCIAVLTRCLPVVYRAQHARFCRHVFQERRTVLTDCGPAFEAVQNRPFGEQLAVIMLRLCFLPGFTCESKTKQQWAGFSMTPIEEGESRTPAMAPMSAYDLPRTQVLRCLLACMSLPLHRPLSGDTAARATWTEQELGQEDGADGKHIDTRQPEEEGKRDMKKKIEAVRFYFVASGDAVPSQAPFEPLKRLLFTSLLFSFATFDPRHVLPYSYQLNTQTSEPFIAAVCHALLLLLTHSDSDHPTLAAIENGIPLSSQASGAAERVASNAFVDACRGLTFTFELKCVWSAFRRYVFVGVCACVCWVVA
jgi:hypothetical protein